MNIKKVSVLLLALSLTLSLAACGGGGAAEPSSPPPSEAPAATPTPEPTPTPTPEADPQVESIDLETESGRLVYSSYAFNDENFEDGRHAILLTFDFTNKASKPAGVQDSFSITVYQNGAEVDTPSSWTVSGLPESVDNFFNTAMKDSTIPIARAYLPKDTSPLTIMVEERGNGDNYQMMELDISAVPAAPAPSGGETGGEAVDAETIDAAVQGSWSLQGNIFKYDSGTLAVAFTNGQAVTGTYTIDTEASVINGTLQATNGTSDISIPYKYEDGTLTLYNNNGQALEKQ